MSNYSKNAPSFGDPGFDFIVAGDDSATIALKLDAVLSAASDALKEIVEEVRAKGELDDHDVGPNLSLRIVVAYNGEGTAHLLKPALTEALLYTLQWLDKYDFLLLDVNGWKPVRICEENEQGVTHGISHTLDVTVTELSDKYHDGFGKHITERVNQGDAAMPDSIEQLIRQLTSS